MWQRSYFYNKARYATRGWHLRWFTLTDHSIRSVPDRANAQRHCIRYPAFREMEVDERRLLIHILPAEEKGQSFFFMAPSIEILEAFVIQAEKILSNRLQGRPRSETNLQLDDFDSGDEFESLIEFPTSGTVVGLFLFVLLYPIRFLMHWTVPDVRVLDINGNPVSSNTGLGVRGNAFLAVGMCLLWLIVGSYAMVASLEALAELLNIPDAVIGFTVSAAGTSLPNYVASKVAAERGLGVGCQ